MNRTFSTFRKRREEKHGPAAQTPPAPPNRLDRRPERADPTASAQNAPGQTASDEASAAQANGSTDDPSNDNRADAAGLTRPIATPAAPVPAQAPQAPEAPQTEAPEPEVEAPEAAASEAPETPEAPETAESETPVPETPASETPVSEAEVSDAEVSEAAAADDRVIDDEPAEAEAPDDAAADDVSDPVDDTTASVAEVTEPEAEAEAPDDATPEVEAPEAATPEMAPELTAPQTAPAKAEAPEVEADEIQADEPETNEPESPSAATEAPDNTDAVEPVTDVRESTPAPPVDFSNAETTRFAAVTPTPAAPIAPAGSPADDNATERFNTGSEAATERINIGKVSPRPVAGPAATGQSAVGNWKAEPAAPQYIPAGGGNPQKRPPENKTKKSRKGLWTSLVALVALIAAAAVAIALVAGNGEDSVAPADVAADRALEYVTALHDGNIVVLRSITCGEAQERFTTMSDQEFAEDHQIQKVNNELVGVDGVKASKIIDDGDAAVVEVIAYKTATPDEKLDVALTLSKIDGEWKVCKG